MTGLIKSVLAKFKEKEADLKCLLGKVIDRDRCAFSRLYKATSNNVYGLAMKILKNSADAEEVAYDAYLQIWNTASRYDFQKSSPLGWIMMITRSRSIDKMRKESKSRRIEDIDNYKIETPAKTPEALTSLSEQQQIVHRAMAKLSDDERKIIELAYFKGLTQSQISKQLDKPLGTVKTIIRRSLISLRQDIIAD
ncbi:MAG: sigma-70 family RNA polymerase sigma factor [Candidatus Dadabacteria bacterium]|nr:sigma-70 family RNA polymerase sigma factor [Candidatus Dadabacteria bacterium]NIS09947.1 sigma-70 family RNA polymerase sigma factor [Candidatus Dadabacteria bacterium]NIV41863.1 sigma-70 family RNA polymerase sigma factor [Candidatus Dadabacteria bacterium]NIY22922.1 sigma-70 family RNA polymerase sigma factor [Candidatus Dadabacteria bacterium]